MDLINREDRSVVTLVLQTIIRPLKPLLIKSTFEAPKGPVKCSPSFIANLRCHVRERNEEGLWVYDLSPKKSHIPHHDKKHDPVTKVASSRRHVFYFAGGGWKMPPSGQHWSLCSKLACSLPDTTITLVSYPLAAAFTAATAYPILHKWYATAARNAVEANETIILAGDSSGGNIALCLAFHAATNSTPQYPLPQPVAVMAICPTVDLSILDESEDAELARTHKLDPVLTLQVHNNMTSSWCGDADPTEPHISPAYADLKAWVASGITLFVITGGYDILTPHALQFRDKCLQAGVKGKWLNWDKQMHVFPLTFSYGIPEGKKAVDWMIECLQTELANDSIPSVGMNR